MTANLKNMLRTHRRGDLIVTPKVEQWLVRHPEGIVLDHKLASRLYDLTVAQPRNREGLWSASAAGACPRAQVFTYLGAPKSHILDPRLQNIFNDGTWRHLRWQMMMLKMGLLSAVEVPVYDSETHMRGTMDGIGEDEDGEWGFELKGIYSTAAVTDGPLENHLLQIHSYFLARPSITRFSLVYEDKRTNLFKEFVIEPDRDLLQDVYGIFDDLNKALQRKELPDVITVCEKGKGQTFNGCGYSTFCLGCSSWEEAIEIAAST